MLLTYKRKTIDIMPSTNSGDLEQVPSNALQTIADYRHVVISLEVKNASLAPGLALWCGNNIVGDFIRGRTTTWSSGSVVWWSMLAFRLILFLRGPLLPTKSFLIEWSHLSTELGLWPGFPHYSSWWNVNSELGDQGRICSHYNTASKTWCAATVPDFRLPPWWVGSRNVVSDPLPHDLGSNIWRALPS